MNQFKILVLFTLVFGFLNSCDEDDSSKPNESVNQGYITENVIILIIDGPRYSETWGDSSHQYQPRLANDLSSQGIIYTNFYNQGETWTNPSHAAISTGFYQKLANNGSELPMKPSLFQYWLKETGKDSTKAWIVASKDKLSILNNTTDSSWNNKYLAATNCGVNGTGVGSGYRDDNITLDSVFYILSNFNPNLMLINFKEPDGSGHRNDWEDYLKGIRDTDEYLYQIWNFIESNPFYSGKTTLFVTNDHGRHIDGHKDGFISHGDDCIGCRHINLFAVGPDFKEDIIINNNRELIDISKTVSELLDFEVPSSEGEVMEELFR